MKSSYLIWQATLLLSLGTADAYGGKGWTDKLEAIKRQARTLGEDDSTELLGDLVNGGATTTVGKDIADILTGTGNPQSDEAGYNAPELGSEACQKDACCVYKYAADEMTAAFKGPSGRCNSFARGAVRLGFHDAGAWNKDLDFGGADGSMILTDEISRSDNRGLEEIVALSQKWYAKYKVYGAGAADLIQLGANVATVVCPLGPRVRSFVGRVDNAQLPPPGLLPSVNADADSLIKLFEDKTIRANGLVALLGAHTTSQQRFVDPNRAFDPQDSTPGVWDNLYYAETLDPNAPARIFKFPSDVKISQNPRTVQEWNAFSDRNQGQLRWNGGYAREYVRLSLLGVKEINPLIECTKVLPPAQTGAFQPPDAPQVSSWLQGGFSSYGDQFGQLLAAGQSLTSNILQSVGINPNNIFGSGTSANPPTPDATDKPYSSSPPSSAPAPPPLGLPSIPSLSLPTLVKSIIGKNRLLSFYAAVKRSVGSN